MLYNMFFGYFNIPQGNIPYPAPYIFMRLKHATTLFINTLWNSGTFGSVKTFK